MVEYNIKTFGNVAIGIHGKELPKFALSRNLKEYWTINDSYNPIPKVSSNLTLNQNKKYWAKPDEMFLSSVRDDQGPKDPFKTTYAPSKYKRDISENVQRINHFKDEAREAVGAGSVLRTKPRWTEIVTKLSANRSVYEDDPNKRESLLRFELLPMPSTFSSTGIFQDPLKKLEHK